MPQNGSRVRVHRKGMQSVYLVATAVLLQVLGAASVTTPTSNCYVIDKSSHLIDFSSWVGHSFEYDGQETDLAVRFCKDVESRSQTGYVDFGRFDEFNYFVAGSGHVDFVQEFYNGDLVNCERSYDKMGRTAQVNIACGGCRNGQCKGQLGCICNVTYESTCRVLVDLAIPCEKQGPRIFEGFTVGFHPRSWEVVYNGMTQFGFEKSHREFSFRTEQSRVALHMTAIASLSSLLQKPVIQIYPEKGLEVSLSGSGEKGDPPTTLSPTVLMVNWRCEKIRDTPYEINITIPVKGFEPIHFTLSKMCDYRQAVAEDSTKGWAVFGIISCIFMVSSVLFCCGGFVYKTRVEKQRGIDALPGMTYLSACLETVSVVGNSYMRTDDLNSAFTNQASWEQPSASSPKSQGPNETKYGAI